MVFPSGAARRYSVIAANTNTFDSARISLKAVERFDIEAHEMTWAFCMDSREAMFRVVMFWMTFLSPKMENTKSCDILPLKLTKLTRTIGKKSWHQGKKATRLSKDNCYALEVRADPKNHFNNHPYLQVNNVIQKVLKRVVIKIKNSK